VIFSDSLSCITALDEMWKIYKPKVVRIMNQIHKEKEHLLLMWIPGHARIQGNVFMADQHAKAGTARRNQQKLHSHCRRLEKLDKGETGRYKTSRMDII
jgi:ribonuclease HI